MPETQLNLNCGLTELKASVDSEYSDPNQLDDAVTGYELLGTAIEQVRQQDIISPLPESEPAGSGDYARSRVCTVRNRLYNLGYLKTDSKSHLLNQSLKNGIRKFQRDVSETVDGFVVDGWVGEQTWMALQELVSFEEPSNVERWFKNDLPCPALLRATQLRLFTLGLMATKPGQIVGELDAALQHFSDICRVLHLGNKPVEAEICLHTVSLLFDQDGLVAQLAGSIAPSTTPERVKIHAFVMNMARIELWMLGFDVVPDGAHTNFSESLNSRLELKIRSAFFKVMVSYWSIHKADESKAKVPSRLFIKSSFPMFFAQLLKDTTSEEKMDADQIYDCLEKEEISLDRVWEHVKAFGSRLWDGVKRIWGWFRNIAKRVASAVVSFVKNISRLAYQYILKSYESVKAVIGGFCDSVSYLLRPEVKMADGMNSSIHHDRDFDFKLFIHSDDAPDDITASAQRLEIRARILNICARIITALIDMLRTIATAFIGWAWLLMGLLKLHREVRELAPELLVLQSRLSG